MPVDDKEGLSKSDIIALIVGGITIFIHLIAMERLGGVTRGGG